MLKKDLSDDNTEIPKWENHEEISFKTSVEMLKWIRDDKENFFLSDKVYDAMIHCLENNIDAIIVSTIRVTDLSDIEVLIRKENFQQILSSYTERLLKIEDYEKLHKIKLEVTKFNLDF